MIATNDYVSEIEEQLIHMGIEQERIFLPVVSPLSVIKHFSLLPDKKLTSPISFHNPSSYTFILIIRLSAKGTNGVMKPGSTGWRR